MRIPLVKIVQPLQNTVGKELFSKLHQTVKHRSFQHHGAAVCHFSSQSNQPTTTSTLSQIKGNIVQSSLGQIEDIPRGTFLGQYLLDHFRSYDDKVAIINGLTGEPVTYSQLLDRITAVSSGLIRMGVRPKDTVTLFAGNSVEWAIAYLTVAATGAVCSAVNPYYTSGELKYVLSHSESKMIITTSDLYPVSKSTLAKMNKTDMKILLCCGEVNGVQNFSSLYRDDRSLFKDRLDDHLNPKDDLVSLPFSSGTTGLPKGVMLTHHNIITNMLQISHSGMMSYNKEDVLTGVLPFYHIYGQTIVLLAGLKHGCTLVTLSKFEPKVFLQNLQDYRVTLLHTAPPMMLFLAKHPLVSKYDLTSIDSGFTGGAPIGHHILDEAAHRIGKPNAAFAQVYGLTESSPATNCNPRDSSLLKKESIGVPVPNSAMKVIDIDTGELLPPNCEGELCFRGDNIMKGYLKNKKATDETLKDGWLHSGDIGYYDEDGFAFITDRLKELIKVKGYQVAPAELESLLLKHPCVDDSAVIGIQDERSGEVPRAYIVLKKGKEASKEDIKTFVKENAVSYKQLAGGVKFVDRIPKSASGKILRRQLREAFKTNNE